MSIHEEVYEGHLIRANNNAAMIFLDGSKSLETKFRAMDLEDAIKKGKAWIDEKLGGRREDRRAPHIGTPACYVEVFKVIKFSKARRLMLVTHRRADDRKLTAAELADAAGWKTAASATTHYSKLGKEVAERLDLKVEGTDKAAWASTVVSVDPETDQLQMHEEVALALDALNIG